MKHCWLPSFSWLRGGKFVCLYFLLFAWSWLISEDRFWPLPVCHQLISSLTAECPVLLALAAVGPNEKNCSQTSALHCSPIQIIIYFKIFFKHLIQMRFIPEEQILDTVYLILSHQNSAERFQVTQSQLSLLWVESWIWWPLQSFLKSKFSYEASIISVRLSPSSTTKLPQVLCWVWWQTTTEYFGADLKIAFGPDK